MMRKLFIILLILCLPVLGWSAVDSHYVTENGAGDTGSLNGSSVENAFSVINFNLNTNWDDDVADDNKIGPGDTVYFSGTITTGLRVIGTAMSGSSSGRVTLDGYEAGDCDVFSASYRAGTSGCYTNQAFYNGTDDMMRIYSNSDYLNIQDFRGTNNPQISINQPTFTGTSDYVTVRRNYLYDAKDSFGGLTRSNDSPRTKATYIIFEENYFIGYCVSDNAASGIGFQHAEGLIIRNNEFAGGTYEANRCDYGTGDSDNVLEIHSMDNLLFEYNYIHDAYEQACVADKEGEDQSNHIYRFNIFEGCTNAGLNIGGGWYDLENYYIYGNLSIDNTRAGFSSYDTGRYHYYWSNVSINNNWQGFVIWYLSSRSTGEQDIYYYNNTIANNGDTDSDLNRSGIAVYGGTVGPVTIKNNLFYNNRPNGLSGNYHQIYETISSITLDYNTLFNTSATATWYYNGAIEPLADMQSAGQEAEGEVADPGFTNPGADTYTLDGSNINDGLTLTDGLLPDYAGRITIQGTTYCSDVACDELLSFSVAIDPALTDWTTTPPTVETVLRSGTWERGAYGYDEESPEPADPVVTVATTNSTVEEGSALDTVGHWTIYCVPDCSGETINWTLSTDSALINDDYNLDDETGATVITGASFRITLDDVDDEDVEGTETATITIASGTGYDVGTPATAIITIYDNDSGPPAPAAKLSDGIVFGGDLKLRHASGGILIVLP